MQTYAEKPPPATGSSGLLAVLQRHWPEYLMEAAALGMFMISACVFTALLEHPSSPIHEALENEAGIRRALMGVLMGSTALAIISSPWGQRSGAHMNPAVTLTFLALGKIAPADALFYVLFQFLGGAAGVLVAGILIGPSLQDSAVNYVVTAPGPSGVAIAFIGEFAISVVMMSTILWISNSRSLSRFTPLFAATLVATFITLEGPLSGMSMNPARTLASAYSADECKALWIYFTAPPAAMLLAAALYRFRRGAQAVFCAKLNHTTQQRCIFNCRYSELRAD